MTQKASSAQPTFGRSDCRVVVSTSSAEAPQQSGSSKAKSTKDTPEDPEEDAFLSLYQVGKTLGLGTFAKVYNARHRVTKEACAVKIVTTKRMSAGFASHLRDEISILANISHPNLIRLDDCFQARHYTYLVMEKLDGGELFDRINQRECYTETKACQLFANLLDAINYLHTQKQIVHRDIKPENILLTSRESDTDVKLADFGFATYCREPYSLRTVCGTPGYKPPEMFFKCSYGPEVDMWSLGVVSYVILAGFTPFEEDNEGAKSVAQICGGVYAFYEEDFGHISSDATDFISQLLTVSQSKRMTAQQALEHPWMEEAAPSEHEDVSDDDDDDDDSFSSLLVDDAPASPVPRQQQQPPPTNAAPAIVHYQQPQKLDGGGIRRTTQGIRSPFNSRRPTWLATRRQKV